MAVATCPNCHRRIGWEGDMVDRPTCKCGHSFSREELEKMDRELEEIEERIFRRIKEKG